MTYRISKIVFLLFFIISVSANSQNISGTVYGNGEGGKQPLPGVNIFWQGTSSGVASGDNGEFTIGQANGEQVLVFSFVGYNTQQVHVHDDDPLEVVLEPNLKLDEVTVVQKDRGTYLSTVDPVHTVRISSAELHKAAAIWPKVLKRIHRWMFLTAMQLPERNKYGC